MSNYKIYSIALSLGIIAFGTASAQKKMFTISEATNGMTSTLATKGLKSTSWEPGTDCFWQTYKKDSTDVYKVIDFANNNVNEFYINQGVYPSDVTVSSLPAIKWLEKDFAYFVSRNKVVFGRLDGHNWIWDKSVTLPDNADNVKVDKSGWIAFNIDNNLWLNSKSNGQMVVTTESDKNIVCGRSVHRDEFGIDGGVFFSPKGNYLAYYRMDQTMVKDYPVVKWDTIPARADFVKYPMAGAVSHEVTLCVFSPKTKNHIVLNTGESERDHYLTCVTWSPDENYIYIGILNRDQNNLKLNKYDAKTGDFIRTLFEESNKKYVHPSHSLTFLPDRNDEFIWWSEKDGFEHLYLYDSVGALKTQLTKGDWVVNEILGFNKSANTLLFTASKESPIEKHVYSVGLGGATKQMAKNAGKIVRIDSEAGMHNCTCSDDGKFVYDVYSAAGVPKNSVVRNIEGKGTTVLLKSVNPLSDYARPEIRNVQLQAADGLTPLYGKIILPINFDSTKKYPVIVYLYNGPNVQLIHNSFPESGNLWYEYMAQHGFIVFTMDGRGSWNRGLEFEQATFRNLGEVEMQDQMKGVAYLSSLKYVDTKRMGVHGWSFGGFMTTSLMLKYPDVFKCAVAGGPVMDWKMYEVMYTERYMDRPLDNPEGYKKSNLLDKVKNLKGKLLLIHGTNDDVVVWQHSINFIRKSVEEGVQVDYFVYPGHEHNVRGKDRVHLMEKISEYFIDNLK